MRFSYSKCIIASPIVQENNENEKHNFDIILVVCYITSSLYIAKAFINFNKVTMQTEQKKLIEKWFERNLKHLFMWFHSNLNDMLNIETVLRIYISNIFPWFL